MGQTKTRKQCKNKKVIRLIRRSQPRKEGTQVFTPLPHEHSAASINDRMLWREDEEENALPLSPKQVLGRLATPQEYCAIEEAHERGIPTEHGYSFTDLRGKVGILKDAGFTRTERRSLIEAGLAGKKYSVSDEEKQKWYRYTQYLEEFQEMFTDEYLGELGLVNLSQEAFDECMKWYVLALEKITRDTEKLTETMQEREKYGLLAKVDIRNAEGLKRATGVIADSIFRLKQQVEFRNEERVSLGQSELVFGMNRSTFLNIRSRLKQQAESANNIKEKAITLFGTHGIK